VIGAIDPIDVIVAVGIFGDIARGIAGKTGDAASEVTIGGFACVSEGVSDNVDKLTQLVNTSELTKRRLSLFQSREFMRHDIVRSF